MSEISIDEFDKLSEKRQRGFFPIRYFKCCCGEQISASQHEIKIKKRKRCSCGKVWQLRKTFAFNRDTKPKATFIARYQKYGGDY